jgi:hypothetical protein
MATRPISGGMWAFAYVHEAGLTCENRTPTHVCEHASFDWGSSGRRFKSCQPANLDWQFAHVAGIDRYAISIRIDQLEVVVTKQLVLSDCIHRQSLFH